jgi:hypothetical protein
VSQTRCANDGCPLIGRCARSLIDSQFCAAWTPTIRVLCHGYVPRHQPVPDDYSDPREEAVRVWREEILVTEANDCAMCGAECEPDESICPDCREHLPEL